MSGLDARTLGALTAARCPDDAARRRFCLSSGIGYSRLVRAEHGRPIAAEATLALCVTLGVDPVTLKAPAAGAQPYGGVILWRIFGSALTVARHLKAHDQRAAAQAAGLSLATLSRAENGHEMSANSYLRLCAYAGRHPHFWTTTRLKASALDALAGDLVTSAMRRLPQRADECFTGDNQ